MKLSSELQQFTSHAFPNRSYTCTGTLGDASFRRYYRLKSDQDSIILVDASQEKNNNLAFFKWAHHFRQHGLRVPDILASDLQQGFLLVSDFGDQTYLKVLTPVTADTLYQQAMETLLEFQSIPLPTWSFPEFNSSLFYEELTQFKEWFLRRHCQMTITSSLDTLLETLFSRLIQQAVSQPQLLVHRDYHSRNLVYLPSRQVGILDFQDALRGPVTYDLLSLLKDAYIDWPEAQVLNWALWYYEKAKSRTIPLHTSPEDFLKDFEWMGVQRHLKILFIFARKYHRDQDVSFLNDIPRILRYLHSATQRYSEFRPFFLFLEELMALEILE